MKPSALEQSPLVSAPHSNRLSTRAGAGFTLIELLTVIAIIGILAAILIPVVGSVRESANAAKCATNLRELSTAYHLYAADHGGRPIDSEFWEESEEDGLWPYLDLTWVNDPAPAGPTVMTCPSAERSNPAIRRWNRNYSVNRHAARSAGGSDTAYYNGQYFLKHVDQAQDPSLLMMFIDGAMRTTRSGDFIRAVIADTHLGNANWDYLFQHNDGVNAVFLDGHVERITRAEMDDLNGLRNDPFWQQAWQP